MRIVSWNIRWGCGRDGRIDLDAIVAVLRTLNPDVICLQEVAVNHPGLEGNASANQYNHLATAFSDFDAIYAPASDMNGDNGRRLFGNLLLSRFTVTQALRHSLPWPADPVGLAGMPRVMIEAVIDSPIGRMRVLTTHLEYYSSIQRMAQIRHIRNLHQEACEQARFFNVDPTLDAPFQLRRRPTSAVLCGDFNCTPDSPEYKEISMPFAADIPPLIDAWQLQHGDAPNAPTAGLYGYAWPDQPDCYDYYFVTEDLGLRLRGIEVVNDTAASDHQPIVLDIA